MILTTVNGQLNQHIDVTNRGFLYGDGLFETCKVKHQTIEYWREHQARLIDGLIRLQFSKITDICIRLDQYLKDAFRNQDKNAQYGLKIIITRNSTLRGYGVDESSVDIVIQLFHLPKPIWKKGVDIELSHVPISVNAALAGIKHLNRLDNVLAKSDLSVRNVDEAWMKCNNGIIHDGIQSNLFYKLENNWFTPPIDIAGVQGIERHVILKCRSDINLRILHESEISQIKQAFVTNRLQGACPVLSINQKPLVNCQDYISHLFE
ncbi:aminodeoxychorismate lyase [Marinicellulosiphila megalodicopiae]|uniref:aminodeoxychorismate lyase n=1 Tax=Marinicellulosiphila megalodicopiae TaxID=2724896 RepID=UPI003BB1797A